MIFILITDQGIVTTPVIAPSLTEAQGEITKLVGVGTGEVLVTAAMVVATAKVTQHPTDASKATLVPTVPDGQAQKTIRDGAKAVIASNTAFINKPDVQPLPDLVTQAKSAARQLNDLYRMLVIGDFST